MIDGSASRAAAQRSAAPVVRPEVIHYYAATETIQFVWLSNGGVGIIAGIADVMETELLAKGRTDLPPDRWQVRKRRTRQAIKRAAFVAFLDGGYLDVSVEQLIAAAGVSRSTFYAHFPNKAALLAALAEDHIEHRHAAFRSLTGLPALTESTIAEWLDDLIDDARANARAVALYRLAVALDAGIMQRFGAARERSAAILASRFAGFDAAAGDPAVHPHRRLAAHAFVITIEQFCSGLADGSWTIDVAATRQALVRQLLDRL